LPALALGVDTPEPGVMQRQQSGDQQRIITHSFVIRMLLAGFLIALCSLVAFWYVLFVEQGGIVRARTAAFMVLVGAQLFHSFNARSDRYSVFQRGIFSNRSLVLAVCISVALQLVIIHVAGMQSIFKTQQLSAADLLLVLVLSSLPLWVVEFVKIFRRRSLHDI
jgi:Ca2+-transporting ATPase